MTDLTPDILRRVCRVAGFKRADHITYTEYWMKDGCGFAARIYDPAPSLLILLAAHAKAAMRKRKWEYEVCVTKAGGASIAFGIPFDNGLCGWEVQAPDCGGYDYDPRDPVSEATAIILAVDEAMRMEV